MKIVILYARSNNDEYYKQTNSTSYQLHHLEKYCSENNIAVLQKFADINDGKDFNRNGFKDMMNYVEKHKEHINTILFTSRERFASQDAFENNKIVARLMSMEIEPKALVNPYFLESNTEQELQEWFEHFKKMHNENKIL